MSQDAKPFALVVRLTVRPGCEAEFDQLVKNTVIQILRNEPGVMRYLCYEVDNQPRQRVFYQEYESRAAFEEHEARERPRQFLRPASHCWRAPTSIPSRLWQEAGLGHRVLRGLVVDSDRVRVQVRARDEGPLRRGGRPDLREGGRVQQGARLVLGPPG